MNFGKPGNPGAKFKGPFEKMIKALSLPKTVKEELGINDETVGDAYILQNKPVVAVQDEEEGAKKSRGGAGSDEDGEQVRAGGRQTDEEKSAMEARLLKQLLTEGRYHILPSFFRTLIYLKKMKKEFAVVFRNYNGQDLQNVVAEFNQFCRGEHPCYNGRNGTSLVKFDGSKGTKEMRIKDKSQQAHFFRGEQGARYVTGANRRAPSGENVEDYYQGKAEEGSVNIVKDTIDQYVAILETLKKRSSLAIQDDKQAYLRVGRNGGKLLLIDQADYGTQHIFFDDLAAE